MSVKHIKRSFKMLVGGIGFFGSIANVGIAHVYCFEKGQYMVGSVWFLFGLCAVYACVDYIYGDRENEG